MSYASILHELLAAMEEESPPPRTNWIPLLDTTGLVLGIAWKHNEQTAWGLFQAIPEGSC